ncbi:MAG TPA: hypothetical protein VEL76_11865, partial [Gemmataceae bacterium]|nr:hypothetical protein [Gemmataceae bacterium]
WVGNVATNVKPSAARIAEERRNVGAERQVRLPVEVAALSATLPTHHRFSDYREKSAPGWISGNNDLLGCHSIRKFMLSGQGLAPEKSRRA